jgi:hypothetical protein
LNEKNHEERLQMVECSMDDSNSESSREFPERRKAVRFTGQLPMELKQGTGMTRNFSTSGIYFETDHSFSHLEPINFFLILEHTGFGPRVRIRCRGEVVRVETGGEKTGVAVAIHSYSIEGV